MRKIEGSGSFLHKDSNNLEAIVRRECSVSVFRAELPEAVSHLIVRGHFLHEESTDANHLHGVGKCFGDIEYVLKRAAVKYERIGSLQRVTDRHIHVMNVGCPLKIGSVDRMHDRRTESFKKRLRELARRGRSSAMKSVNPIEDARICDKVLPADHGHRLKVVRNKSHPAKDLS